MYHDEKINCEKDIVAICKILKKENINVKEINEILLQYNCDHNFDND